MESGTHAEERERATDTSGTFASMIPTVWAVRRVVLLAVADFHFCLKL